MTEQDKAKLKEVMNRTAVITDKAMTTAHYETYFELLVGFPIEAVAAAFNQALQKNTFFPRPAELLEILEGSDADRASYAWSAFLEAAANGGYASIKFLDPATAYAVDAVFGGWVQACKLLAAGCIDENGNERGGCTDEMVASYRNHFLKVYSAARRNPRQVETYRAGLSELSMREGSGEWKNRMSTLIQPVLLVGEKATKEVKLPFDVAAGTLTGEAMAQLSAGPRAVMAFAEAYTPVLLAKSERRMLRSAPEPPATKEEIAAIMAEVKTKYPNSPYLRLITEAVQEDAA